MNKITKIGLSALAGSLVAMSVNAAEMSVTGGASLTVSDQGLDTEGNKWTMGNSITFAASGELDNGMSVSASYELDDDIMDDYSMTFGTDAMGTIQFHGSGGSSAMSAVDDMTPNAYEEAWHGGAGNVINGHASTNIFKYVSPTAAGLTLTASYLPSSEAGSVKSSTAYAISYSPEMVEGLTVGYATQDDESGSATTSADDSDENTMYVKYVYGPVTVGYQESELDSDTNSEDADSQAFGISYAVSDSLTIAYGEHTYETTGDTSIGDQESSAVSASYTMGGMTIAAVFNSTDSISGSSGTDAEFKEISVAFAF